MTITVTIPKDAEAAFDAYLATQVTVDLDPITHAKRITKHHADIAGYVQDKIDDAVAYVTANFTPAP